MVTLNDVITNKDVRAYIEKADESLIALGYTEHSFPHVKRVSETAMYILRTMGYGERDIELAGIAGFLHDIGNLVNRIEHAQSGAIMAFKLLSDMGMEASELATVLTAIGNHDEGTAVAVNHVAAALILADKTDVRFTRVRNADMIHFDIHDRVNYAVRKSDVTINEDKTKITLDLTIDTEICAVMDYFEIFIDRMVLCRNAAQKLGLKFVLIANGQRLL